MDPEPIKTQFENELETLRSEVAELRAVQHIHRHTEQGLHDVELQLAGVIHSAMDAIITIDEMHQRFRCNSLPLWML